MSSADTQIEQNSVTIDPKEERKAMLGWLAFGVASLIFFTFMKVPAGRMKNFVQGTVTASLRPHGITLSAEETDFSLFLTPSYSMKNARLTIQQMPEPIKLDNIEVRPHLLPLVLGKKSASATITKGDTELDLTVEIDEPSFSLDFDLENLDIQKTALLSALAQIKGSGVLNAEGDISGQLSNLAALDGDISITGKNIQLDAQSIYGFDIPKIKISGIRGNATAQDGKLKIKRLNLGRANQTPPDDLVADLKGDITLGRTARSSKLNLNTRLSVSDSLKKSSLNFVFNAIMAAAKQKDGSYAYDIKGTLAAPFPAPKKAAK